MDTIKYIKIYIVLEIFHLKLKKEFYGKMEEIFNRGVDKEGIEFEVKTKDISTLKRISNEEC